MRRANPLEDGRVMNQGSRPDAARDQEDVGAWHLIERPIDGETQKSVVGADLALSVADEADLRVRKALKHFVRPNRV
jgi:hypothetical protein